jgi:hypothetical protein
MNHPITILLDQTRAKLPGYRYSLMITNDSSVRLLFPFPEITGLVFQARGVRQDADWGTSILVSGAGGGHALDPGQSREFNFDVRTSQIERPKEEDLSDYYRWSVALGPRRYDTRFRFGVDSGYFDPVSHWELPELEELAYRENATVWLGQTTSNLVPLLDDVVLCTRWPAGIVHLAHALRCGDKCSFALHDALLEAGHEGFAEHFQEERWHSNECIVIDRILAQH